MSTTAESRFPSARWADWAGQIGDLQSRMVNLITKRKIWNSYTESLRGATPSEAESVVHEWLQQNYVDSVAVGLRRVLDATKGTRSLLKLLESMERGSVELSFDNFSYFWRLDASAFAAQDAREMYRPFTKDGKEFDVAVLRRDRARLKTENSVLIKYVNDFVAHANANANGVVAPPITYGELHKAFDDVAEVANKYYTLLTCASMLTHEAILPPGWQNVFRRMAGS